MRKLNEECGIFGVYSKEDTDVAYLCYLALYALQHRGQESCGIVVNKHRDFSYRKDLGLVQNVFTESRLKKLGDGNIAVGHVRYSTTGENTHQNIQPLYVKHVKGPLAIAHNGNLTNAQELKINYELQGKIFHTTNDSEVISYAITEGRIITDSIEAAIEHAMTRIKGAYSLVVMSPQKLIAVRDPNGFRPLCIGVLPNGSYVFASESCALDIIGAKFVRDLLPGEIVIADNDGLRSITTHCNKAKSSLCIFEFVYFARPDSVIQNVSVHTARLNAGRLLWEEEDILTSDNADVVIGAPDSGLDGAMGYALASGIPYDTGFTKNRYIGRTFIAPTQTDRQDAIKIKLNAIRSVVNGKRVVLTDDSIVRGNTCEKIIKLLRESGAKEVHFRVCSPPFIGPCYYGTDVPDTDKLIFHNNTIDSVAKAIGVDSLRYLSEEGIKKTVKDADCEFCTACFNKNYPVLPSKFIDKN